MVSDFFLEEILDICPCINVARAAAAKKMIIETD